MLNPSRVDDDPDFQILLRELVADSSRDDDDPDFQTLVANSSSQASDQPGPGIPPYSLSHFAPNSLSSGGQLPVATRVQEVIRQLPADHAHFHAYGSTTLLTSTYDTQNQSATVAEGPGNDVREQPTEQGRSPKAYVLKNRRAQQRFKAKQRNDKKDLQDQLKQLTQQLSNLKVQNSHLSSKHTMLETDLLSQEALVAQTLALTAPLHSSAAPESRLAAFKVLQPQHLDTVQSDWKTAAKQKLLQMPSHIRDALSTARTMDVIDARDELIDSMTRVLEAYETDRESEEKFRALRDQVTITATFFTSTILSNPVTVRRVFGLDWTAKGAPVYSSKEYWQSFVAALELTYKQKAAIALLHQRFQAGRMQARQEQHSLYQALHQGSTSDSLDTAVSPALLQEQQQHFKGLQGALSRETLQYGQLYGGVLEMVFTPLQYARACVRSQYLVIDVPAIAACIYEELCSQGVAPSDDF